MTISIPFFLVLVFTFLGVSLPTSAETVATDLYSPYTLGKQPPIIIKESPYSFHETLVQVKRAIQAHNFAFIRLQDFEDEYHKTSYSGKHGREAILYFCNFDMLEKALSIDKRVGVFLPCRISIIERNGKVMMLVINPKVLGAYFANHSLDHLCQNLYQAYNAILDEAAL